MAARLGPGRNDYNTEFSPANVGLFEIAVAVELGDAGGALQTAEAVDTAGLSAERRARTLIDVARTYPAPPGRRRRHLAPTRHDAAGRGHLGIYRA
jgi:hypothetical protein